MLSKYKKFFQRILFILFFAGVITPVFAASPKLEILAPKNGEVVNGNKVTVQYFFTDFNFVDFAKNTELKEGEGHMHLWLDEKNPEKGSAAMLAETDPYVFQGVKSGDHILTAELVDNQHNSFNPQVKKIVKFSTIEIQPPIENKEAVKQEAVPQTPPVQETAPSATNTQIYIFLIVSLIIIIIVSVAYYLFVLKNKQNEKK